MLPLLQRQKKKSTWTCRSRPALLDEAGPSRAAPSGGASTSQPRMQRHQRTRSGRHSCCQEGSLGAEDPGGRMAVLNAHTCPFVLGIAAKSGKNLSNGGAAFKHEEKSTLFRREHPGGHPRLPADPLRLQLERILARLVSVCPARKTRPLRQRVARGW